ncbi:MAG TPA: hypothetical protein VMT52_16865 [Planctomycetota bacterium]|nr:hypothetical protein [Planctomycetota bacterium]
MGVGTLGEEDDIEAHAASFTFSQEDLKALLQNRSPPCVSIYLPTHRRKTEGRPDAILYRNLLRDVERMLQRDLPGPAAREVVDSLKGLDRDEFWDDGRRSDGLAIFASPGFLACYRLPGEFPELQVVGGSFHTKPILRFLQGNALSYHLIALNAQRVALYTGIGDEIQEVPLPDVPQSLGEDLQAEDRSRGVRLRGGVKGGHRVHYGQSGPKEHAKADLEKFFRIVAKDLWKNHLRASSKPVILAAPSHYQPIFRKVAQIPTLIEAGISVDPAKMSPDELKVEAKRVLEPEIERRIAAACDELGLARHRNQGSDSLQDVARAVMEGRVKTLFVESGRRIWGVVDTTTGEVLPGDRSRNAHDVDLLDELAELSLVRGAEVFVLKKDAMPTPHGVAAIYRF